jgi:ABC-type cobalt transport system substrate-binding protein
VEQPSRGHRTASRARRRARPRQDSAPPVARLGWILALSLLSAVLIGGLVVMGSKRGPEVLSSASVTGPMLGSSAASTSQLSQLTSDFGHLPVVRVYYPGLPAANAWSSSGKAGANHSEVVVSFKALPSAILSGADDAALSHFFDTAPTSHPVYYSYWHEPEDNIEAAQFTLTAYKAAWAHVVALADAAHNPELHSTLILMAYDLDKSSGRDWKDYLPSGGIISTLGWDAYPAGAVADRNPQLTPPAVFMGPAVAASKSVGLPFGFAEFGVPDMPGRAAWLDEVGNYILHSGAVFGTLFQGADLADASSITAWRSMITASLTGTPVTSASPVPTVSAAPTTAPVPSVSPTATPTSSPTSSSPASAAPTPAPLPTTSGPGAPGITGLAVSPADLTASGSNHATVSFTLTQNADVTVCVLDSAGNVVRRIDKPSRSAGRVSVAYYGYDGSGHRLAAGRYEILVVASNSQASSTAETLLTISSP